MKLLHTADWHVGKPLRGRKRDDEYHDVLAEILDIARHEQVDALLLAGDVFDIATPPAEAEQLVFQFFRELVGARIPAVVIGGNHDHARRLNAIAGILELVDIHARGEPVTSEAGGVVALPSRDGREIATIAALPWVPEREVVRFASLMAGAERPFQDYADGVGGMLDYLARSFRPDTVNVLLAHLYIDGATVGGGERALHLGQTYAVTPQRLPRDAQYIALGHVHRPQRVLDSPPAHYPGSPLQLDFGEREQEKGVVLVEVEPGRPAHPQTVALRSGRRLEDVHGTLEELAQLAPTLADAYLRVFVRVEGPVADLARQVREILPNAVDVQRDRPPEPQPERPGLQAPNLGPHELFQDYYRQQRGRDMPEPVAALFRQLYDEESRETDSP